MVDNKDINIWDDVPEEERKRVLFILGRAQKMNSAKSKYTQKWLQYERLWKMFEEERTGDDEWRANLPDTWPYAAVKTAQSLFIDSQVSPVFRKHQDDNQSKAKDLADLYKDISEKGNLDKELYYARLDAFKLGNGFLMSLYVKDRREVYEIDKFNPQTEELKFEKKEILDFDDPKTVRVSPYLVLLDEHTRGSLDSARDAIVIEILPYDTAVDRYYHYLGSKDKFRKRVKRTQVLKQFINQLTGQRIAQTADTNTGVNSFRSFRFFAPVDIDDSSVEILHYWGQEKDSYEIVINGAPVKVRTDKNPSPIPYIHKKIPLIHIPFSPYSGDEIWAAGLLEIGEMESRAVRRHREMMSDRQKLSLFSPVFIDVNDEIDQKVMRLKPLNVYRTRGGVPKLMQIPGITNADALLVSNFEDAFRRVTGIDERTLGIFPSSKHLKRMTATEISALKESSLRRLREFMFLYSNSLIREVKLKVLLFKQYYASPLKRFNRSRNSKEKELANMVKRYSVRQPDSSYVRREVTESLFEGDIDVDIDMQALLPLTKTEHITRWAQLLRDVTPFVQAKVIDIDLAKIIEKYIWAFDVNPDTLRQDKTGDSLQFAEAEHKLFADPNTSDSALEMLKDGTPEEYLTALHLKRHHELKKSDIDIRDKELRNLSEHIAKDMKNFQDMMFREKQQQDLSRLGAGLNQVGGVNPFQEQQQLPEGERQEG